MGVVASEELRLGDVCATASVCCCRSRHINCTSPVSENSKVPQLAINKGRTTYWGYQVTLPNHSTNLEERSRQKAVKGKMDQLDNVFEHR
jgi:hypothetical protein